MAVGIMARVVAPAPIHAAAVDQARLAIPADDLLALVVEAF
jgi:hypothetical protein